MEVAAISRRGNELNARVRAWFSSEPEKGSLDDLSRFPSTSEFSDECSCLPSRPNSIVTIVHVTIERPNGDVLWQKTDSSHARA